MYVQWQGWINVWPCTRGASLLQMALQIKLDEFSCIQQVYTHTHMAETFGSVLTAILASSSSLLLCSSSSSWASRFASCRARNLLERSRGGRTG